MRTAGFLSTMLLTSLFAGSGCDTPSRTDPAVPMQRAAVLVAPSDATRAELARDIGEALNGATVRLSDDALMRDGELIIERTVRRDAAGLPINGRSTEKPERFQLVEQGGRCILIHERTGRRWMLHSATCAPAPRR